MTMCRPVEVVLESPEAGHRNRGAARGKGNNANLTKRDADTPQGIGNSTGIRAENINGASSRTAVSIPALQNYTAKDPSSDISTHWEVSIPAQYSNLAGVSSRPLSLKHIRKSSDPNAERTMAGRFIS